MNYEETLARIHSFEKFGSRLGLERMNRLLERLGNPQKDLPVIHVAGTNGKGSVCRFLVAALQEHGYRTGLYTSPFLERFTERIEFDGAEISEEDLISCAEPVFIQAEAMLCEGQESPTEFELVTAIAFVYYSRKPVDFVVLEVGLGGRGDSTNVIESPLATVITSISPDHTEILGNTLAQIAEEKAGILKVGRPVITSASSAEALAVIRRRAAALQCELFSVSDCTITECVVDLEGSQFELATPFATREMQLGMLGYHQMENAACALLTLEVLEKYGILSLDPVAIRNGFQKARHKGRLERLGKDPFVIIDGAHNEGGAAALVRLIDRCFRGKRILLVVGLLTDKKIDHILAQLLTLEADCIATEPLNPRRLPAKELCAHIRTFGRTCEEIAEPDAAYRQAMERSQSYDLVLFTGSLYLIGRIRETFANDEVQ